jgi:hypothetical protein
MLQANPAMTPNQVKAILQYTAQVHPGYDPLTQGAGFLNAGGAVDLARFFATGSTSLHPVSSGWSRRVIWGNRLYSKGWLTRNANAWNIDVTWGDRRTSSGGDVRLGVLWQSTLQNVVWGTACGGADCQRPWTVEGVSYDDSVVWGTENSDSVVWGTADDESVVWGTNCGDPACEPLRWPHP